MKQILLNLSLFLLGIPLAVGQLPNGSVAPNWTMADLNGTSHTLYNYLNDQKVVFLDFSATWCGPCWNYHNSNAFKNLHNQYGPPGSNDVVVFMIEGDGSTNTACLYGPQGCVGGTQGNWVQGTPYPIIDNASQTGAYSIAYYPTIYGVCPDKKIYEVGQVGTSGLWNFAVGCSAPSITSASVTNIGCYGNTTGAIQLNQNGGIAPFTYNWSNGATTQNLSNLPAGSYSVTITGKLGGTIEYGPITVSQPAAPLQAQVMSVNPAGCNGIGGTAEVGGTGGSGGYSFLWNNGSTQSFQFNLQPGTYSCTVTDLQGCTSVANNIVVGPAVPPTAQATAPSQLNCQNTTLTLSGNGSTTGPNLSYLWTTNNGNIVSGENTLNSCVVSAPGTYQLLVLNTSTACTAIATVTVTANTLQPVAQTAGANPLSCNQPQATLSGAGSSTGTNIQYLWTTIGGNIVSGANTLTPVVNAGGSYILSVTNNANGCVDKDTVVLLANTTPPNASATAGEINCVNTSVTLQGNSTTPNATYAWSGPAGYSSSEQAPVVSNTGTYQLVVTNPANGCTQSASVQVVQNNTPPEAQANGGTLTCAATAVMLSGGSNVPGSTFAWTGPNGFSSNEQNPQVGSAGNYELVVTGTNGCTSSAAAIVNQNTTAPTASAGNNASLNCAAATVVLNGTASSTGSQFSYEWSTMNGNILSGANTLTPTVNSAGTYSLVVTNANNGCNSEANVTVFQAPPATAEITAQTNVSCFGTASGSATALAGGVAPFTYEWSNGATAEAISNLSAGTYTVVVTDAEGCTATAEAVISQPSALILNATATAQTAPGVNDGTATASLNGGTPGYSYLWSNGATTETIENLTPGAYTVTATDANGCTQIQTVTVNEFGCALSAAISGQQISCYGASDGVASITLNNATEPYSYEWSNGENTQSITGLAPGLYAVTATDENGCAVISSISIQEPPVLNPNATSTSETSQGGANGTATANPTGGTEPYSYIWNTGATSASITGLPSANYSVTVTDANGCSAVQTVPVAPFACAMGASVSSSNVSCFGENNGQATVVISAGLSPFSYSWSNGGTTATASGLAPGIYTVTINDAVNCGAEAQVLITEPSLLEVAATGVTNALCGEASGAVSVAATGGNGNYSFQWSNGTASASLENLAPGSYTVSVTDANECLAILAVTVLVEDLEAPVVVTQNISLSLDANGTAAITPDQVDNGSSDNCEIVQMTLDVSSFDCSALGPNEVLLSVTDAGGNISTASAIVTVVDNSLPQIAVQSITLELDASGHALLSPNQIDNGSSDNCGIVSMAIDVMQFDCNHLGDNPVTLTIADAAGNQVSGTAIVTVVDKLAPAVECPQNMTLPYCNPVGEYAVSAQDNCSDLLTYQFPTNYPSGSEFPTGTTALSISVTDANGNTAVCEFTVTVPEAMTAEFSGESISCFGENDGSVAANATGGAAGYTYLWSNGATSASISDLGPGTYSVSITDATGCVVTGSASIQEPAALVSTLVALTNETGNQQNGAVDVTVSGGVQPYSFSWQTSNGTVISNEEDISGLSAGDYRLYITDANGCNTLYAYTIQSVVSVTDQQMASRISLFPNPTSGRVTLSVEDVKATSAAIQVFDLNGKLMYFQPEAVLSAGNHELDLSGAASGVYMVRIMIADNLVTKRLVINRM
jgi:hypothetical protein